MLCKTKVDMVRDVLRPVMDYGLLEMNEFKEIISILRNSYRCPQRSEEIGDETLTQGQLAERWSVSTRQIRNYEKVGKIRREPGLDGHPKYKLWKVIEKEKCGKWPS